MYMHTVGEEFCRCNQARNIELIVQSLTFRKPYIAVHDFMAHVIFLILSTSFIMN